MHCVSCLCSFYSFAQYKGHVNFLLSNSNCVLLILLVREGWVEGGALGNASYSFVSKFYLNSRKNQSESKCLKNFPNKNFIPWGPQVNFFLKIRLNPLFCK